MDKDALSPSQSVALLAMMLVSIESAAVRRARRGTRREDTLRRTHGQLREEITQEVVGTHLECVGCGEKLRFSEKEFDRGTQRHYHSRSCRKKSRGGGDEKQKHSPRRSRHQPVSERGGGEVFEEDRASDSGGVARAGEEAV